MQWTAFNLGHEWKTSWEHVPLLRFIMPMVSLPAVLTILMILDQSAQLLTFQSSIKTTYYGEMASAASPDFVYRLQTHSFAFQAFDLIICGF